MRELRQIKGRIWLGRMKVVFSRIGAYVSYINFLILVLTFYTIKGYKYTSLEIFLMVAISGIIALGIFDYFIMLPCEQVFGNEQVAKHQNPIYEKIKEVDDVLGDAKRELEEVKTILRGGKK